MASRRLQRSFGCMAKAVAWLHDKNVRHKDLKPSQFLLSKGGLWLTDFGWSKDMSLEEHSVTEGFDRITARYHSPERASGNPCGKPEDVFSLGCTFLEMIYRLGQPWRGTLTMPGFQEKGWSFHEQLGDLPNWMDGILATKGIRREHVARIIVRMLETRPSQRPIVTAVVDHLSAGTWTIHRDASYSHDFFGHCCQSCYIPYIAPDLSDVAGRTYDTVSTQPRFNSVPCGQDLDEDREGAAAETPNIASVRPNDPKNEDILCPALVSGSGVFRQNQMSSRTRTQPTQYCEREAVFEHDPGAKHDAFKVIARGGTLRQTHSTGISQGGLHVPVTESSTSSARPQTVMPVRSGGRPEARMRLRTADRLISGTPETQRSNSSGDIRAFRINQERFTQQMEGSQQKARSSSASFPNRVISPKISRRSSSLQTYTPSTIPAMKHLLEDEKTVASASNSLPLLAAAPRRQVDNGPGLVRSKTVPFPAAPKQRPVSPSNVSEISSTNATLNSEDAGNHVERRASGPIRQSEVKQWMVAPLSEQNLDLFSLQQRLAKARTDLQDLSKTRRPPHAVIVASPPDWSRNFDGDYWCAIDGCSARFREQSDFALHGRREHPEEPSPVLETHDIAKLLIRTAGPSGELLCDVGNCTNGYGGHYREQSLVSHKKRKHAVSMCIWRSKTKALI